MSQTLDKAHEDLAVQTSVAEVQSYQSSVITDELIETLDDIVSMRHRLFVFFLDVAFAKLNCKSSLLNHFFHSRSDIESKFVVLISFVNDHIPGQIERTQLSVSREHL